MSSKALPPTASRPLIALLLALLAQCASFAAAEKNPGDIGAAASAVAEGLTVPSVVLGIAAMVVGFLFCFFGSSMWRLAVFFAGVYVFSSVALSVMLRIEADRGPDIFGRNREWILLGVSAAVGIVGGFFSLCLYRLGVFMVGAAGGFFAAMWILSMSASGLIQSPVGRWAVIVGLMLVVGVLALKFEKHVVIVSTAVAGASSMVFGIDCFANTGVRDAATNVVGSRQAADLSQLAFDNPVGAYALLVCVVVLALLGAVFQYRRYTGLGRK